MRTPPKWLILMAGVGVFAGRSYLRSRERRRADQSGFRLGAATRLVGTGLPDSRSVRVWLRTDRPGSHRLVLTDPAGRTMDATFEVPDDPATDGTAVVRWPEDTGGPELAPFTRYTYRVSHADGAPIGEGRFTTAPLSASDAPDRFAIGIASCHQPFTDAGALRPESLRLLDTLEDAYEQHGVQQVLLLGDQMYTDLPKSQCLFDARHFRQVAPPGRRDLFECTRAEVRALLQERYRIFWKVAAFQRIQARWPTSCILDDHEIIDNFGSDPDHHSPRWAALRAGALDAFHDYQALRNHDRAPTRPVAFPTRFTWGPLAGLVLDLRSERTADEDHIRIVGEGQWALLDRFLAEEGARPVLLLGLSVPLLHVPEWLVEAGAWVAPEGSGVHDRWSHPKACADRDRLVRTLYEHRRRYPQQQVVLVSGDVHVGAVSELVLGDAPPVLQLVSSAVSNLERRMLRAASDVVVSSRPSFETADGLHVEARLLQGTSGSENPFPGLNAGLIELRRDGARWRVRVLLVSHDAADPPGPRVVFDSADR